MTDLALDLPAHKGLDQFRPNPTDCLRHGAGPLFAHAVGLRYDAHEFWAWDHYKDMILSVARGITGERQGPVRLMEIGGGRDPLFSLAEAERHRLAITVNDIDAGELALAPTGYTKACFDIAGDIDPAWHGTQDVIFSNMVFEHVADVERAWNNVRALLAPGGVAIAFFPTLMCPPFVINAVFPERLTQAVLRWFFPVRNASAQPKFPALYQWCSGDQKVLEPRLRAIGFRDVTILPFWTHSYFRHIPVLRGIDHAFSRLARRRDWRLFTSYAYAMVRR